MGVKFGAPQDLYESILETCKKIDIKVRGVSFHVGSGGCSFETYKKPIDLARGIFERAKKLGMPEMDFLDLGGGFAVNPLSNPENTFSIVAPKIRKYLNETNFPGISKVKIIGEPGRFISAEALSIVVQIYLVRE